MLPSEGGHVPHRPSSNGQMQKINFAFVVKVQVFLWVRLHRSS